MKWVYNLTFVTEVFKNKKTYYEFSSGNQTFVYEKIFYVPKRNIDVCLINDTIVKYALAGTKEWKPCNSDTYKTLLILIENLKSKDKIQTYLDDIKYHLNDNGFQYMFNDNFIKQLYKDVKFEVADEFYLEMNLNTYMNSIRMEYVIKACFDKYTEVMYVPSIEYLPKLETMIGCHVDFGFHKQSNNVIIKHQSTKFIAEKIVKVHDFLVYKPYYDSELYIQDVLSKYDKVADDPNYEVDEVDEAEADDVLNREQRIFVKLCNENKFSILTGPPGSGKTSTVKHAVSKFDHTILLAPTNTAVRNIKNVIKCDTGYTIHKFVYMLLDINLRGKILESHPEYGINSVIVADEMSMCDVEMWAKLLKVWRTYFSKASLVIVGDTNQLPSIRPGNVLEDILIRTNIPRVLLKEVYRQGNNMHLLNGILNVLDAKVPEFDQEQLLFVEKQNDEIFNFIFNDITIKNKDNWIILSPQKKGEVGVYMLNRLCQQHFNRNGKQITVKFRVNDKVIFKINNEHVCNGTIGKIVKYIDKTNKVYFTLEDGIIYSCEATELNNIIDHGWALTVHKAQGKQYDYVYIPMVKDFKFMLSKDRRLLYTGISRAKTNCTMIGHIQAINTACKAPIPKRVTYLFKDV